MQLVPDWAPNIHPIIVHFPLALLSLAVFSSFLETVLAQELISKTRLWLYILGTISALAAVLSGRGAGDTVNPPFKAEMTLGNHSDMAHYTLYFFIAFTAVQILLVRFGKPNKKLIKVLLLIVASVGLFLLYQTGDLGGKLVYKYGVGISK